MTFTRNGDTIFSSQFFEPLVKAGYRVQEWRSWMYDVPQDESRVMELIRRIFRAG